MMTQLAKSYLHLYLLIFIFHLSFFFHQKTTSFLCSSFSNQTKEPNHKQKIDRRMLKLLKHGTSSTKTT